MAAIDSLRGLFGLKGGKPAGTAIGAAQIAARIGGRGEGAEATAEHARPAAGQTGRRAGGQHLMSDIDRASRAWRDGPTQPGTSIAGIDADALVAGVRGRGHRDARRLEKPEALARLIADIARPDDLVICLGAGSITQWAYALPAQLESIRPAAGGAS